MAMVSADWTITRSSGNIRYIGDDHGGTAPSYATVIEFHRWLQDFADDAEFTGNDELDIVDSNPSDRSTDNIITLVNGFNITATEAEHLYDGTITQGSGPTEERWDGIVNFGNAGVRINVLQNGAKIADDFWNFNVGGTDNTSVGAAFLTDSTQSWTTNQWVGYTIKNVTDGSEALITANTATTITGTLRGGSGNNWDSGDAYLISQGLNSDSVQGISHRFMIKVRADGTDIDQRRLIGTARTFNRTYAEFKINGTSRGNNVLALNDSSDLNNTTAEATVSGWSTITNTEGLRLLDINNDTTNEEYYSEWNRATFTINQFYERLKWLSRTDSASTLNGLTGYNFRGITHSFAYDNETGVAPATNDELAYGTNIVYNTGVGTFTIGEAVHEDTATPLWKGRILAWDDNTGTGSLIVDIESGTVLTTQTFTGQSSGATATVNGTPTAVTTGGVIKVFAVDDDGTTGNLYGQVIKGRAPVNNDRLYDDLNVANFVDVNGTVTERTISTPFVGVSTGSALIGSYGLGMEPADTSAADTFFDLTNTAITPPNNVTFTIDGLVSGEDYVLIGTNNAGDFDFGQYTLNGLLSGPTVTSVVVNGSIESETPTTGTIRITRANGLISRHPYSAWSGSTFTITSHDFSTNNANNGANVFTSYIDKLADATSLNFSYVYNASRTLFIRVRDGGTAGDAEGTKTFETTATVGTNGGTATNIRTSDV